MFEDSRPPPPPPQQSPRPINYRVNNNKPHLLHAACMISIKITLIYEQLLKPKAEPEHCVRAQLHHPPLDLA